MTTSTDEFTFTNTIFLPLRCLDISMLPERLYRGVYVLGYTIVSYSFRSRDTNDRVMRKWHGTLLRLGADLYVEAEN